MVSLRRVLGCVLLCATLVCAAGADSSAKNLAKNLKGKVVFLRGMEMGDKLSFDAQGAEVGAVTPGPFDYSAVKIEKVHESGAELEIKAKRVALVFRTASESPSLSDIRFVPLSEQVDITIAIDRAHPETEDAAIQKVLAFSPQDALAGKSVTEETAALDSIGSTAPNNEPITSYAGSQVYDYKPGAGITPPRLTYSVDPTFTDDAKKKRISGICVLSMIVDTNGRPERIRLVRPVDPGLDVSAIVAASQYRFTPAEYQEKPVPVLIHVEISFRIY